MIKPLLEHSLNGKYERAIVEDVFLPGNRLIDFLGGKINIWLFPNARILQMHLRSRLLLSGIML